MRPGRDSAFPDPSVRLPRSGKKHDLPPGGRKPMATAGQPV